jgi:hypothetical protein
MSVKLMMLALLLSGIAGCNGSDARAEPASAGRVVDSALPREEALRRFREKLPHVDSLAGGTKSRDELVAAYLRALASADTAALLRLAVTRAEFAWLYYPTTPMGKPPYDLEPGLMWFLHTERNDEGLSKALQLYGGKPMTLVDYDCGPKASHEGENIVYGPCALRWRTAKGDTLTVRLFNQILERGGRFKILSFGNRLD